MDRFRERFTAGTDPCLLLRYAACNPQYRESISLLEEALKGGEREAANSIVGQCLREYGVPPICSECLTRPNEAATFLSLAKPVLLLVPPKGLATDLSLRPICIDPDIAFKPSPTAISEVADRACPHLLGPLREARDDIGLEEINWLSPYAALMVDASSSDKVIHTQITKVINAYRRRYKINLQRRRREDTIQKDLEVYRLADGINGIGVKSSDPCGSWREVLDWAKKKGWAKSLTGVRDAYNRAYLRIYGQSRPRRTSRRIGTRTQKRHKEGYEIVIDKTASSTGTPDDILMDVGDLIERHDSLDQVAAILSRDYEDYFEKELTADQVLTLYVESLRASGLTDKAILERVPSRHAASALKTLRRISSK